MKTLYLTLVLVLLAGCDKPGALATHEDIIQRCESMGFKISGGYMLRCYAVVACAANGHCGEVP